MADQIPIKVMCDGLGNTCGLAQFTSSDSLAVSVGGTGLTTQGISGFAGPGISPQPVACANTFIGICAGIADTGVGTNNTYVGHSAGRAATTSDYHTLIGANAGKAITTCSGTTAVGFNAGCGITFGMMNTLIGYSVGNSITTADCNTGLGYLALSSTICDNNVAIGTCAMTANTQGQNNVAVGHLAGKTQVAAGCNNTFIGACAAAVALCSENTIVGAQAGIAQTTGVKNVFLGTCVGYGVQGGSNNVYIGHHAGLVNTSGNANVFIGNCAGAGSTASCCLIIGNGTCDIITGNFNTASLGINAPIYSTLTVGVNDTGYDVTFFGATSGCKFLWDESANQLEVVGTSVLCNTLTVGVNDTGYDVTLFGATSGCKFLWDESANKLIVTGDFEVTGTSTGTGTTFANDANNRVVTGTGSGLNGEANLTFDGNALAMASSSVAGQILSLTNSGTNSYPTLRFVNDATTWNVYGANGGSGTSPDAFQIENAAGGLFVIQTGGNVGIGTAAPGHTFNSVRNTTSADVFAGSFKDTTSSYQLQVHGTSGAVTGTHIENYMESPSPADGDFVGLYSAQYKDAGGNKVVLGTLGWFADDVTAGTIDSKMEFKTTQNNATKIAYLTAAGVWTDASAAAGKDYLGTRQEIWPDGILAKIKTLNVSKYQPADQPEDKPVTETHVSPTAEDFWDALQIGTDPRAEKLNKDGENTNTPTIAAKDLGGVALVAIQELLERVEALESA